MRTFDDQLVKDKHADDLRNSYEFQASAYLLFYFRDSIKEMVEYRNCSDDVPEYELSSADKKQIEGIWFGFKEAENASISREKLLTIKWNTELNTSVVSDFTALCKDMQSGMQVLTLTDLFTESIKSKNTTATDVVKALDNETFFEHHCVLVPIFQSSERKDLPGHFSICALYPMEKVIMHTDSLRSEKQSKDVFKALLSFLLTFCQYRNKSFNVQDWIFLCPRTLPQQKGIVDCGVFACLNAYNLSNGNQIIFEPHNLPVYRYWICYVLQSKRKVFIKKQRISNWN